MKLTPEKLVAFCAALAETCNVGRSCAAVGISRMTAYQWRKSDPAFAASWDDALKAGLTGLEDEAHRRAFEGHDKPLVHLGQFTPMYGPRKGDDGEVIIDADGAPKMFPVLDEHGKQRYATMKEYSDTLAIFLLKAHAPEKYRERSEVAVTGKVELASAITAARQRARPDGDCPLA